MLFNGKKTESEKSEMKHGKLAQSMEDCGGHGGKISHFTFSAFNYTTEEIPAKPSGVVTWHRRDSKLKK